jgi:predicted HAD superfamily phosphohydrolase
MKYAHYNTTTNKLLGWYDDTIHTTIPTPTIEVSETEWQTAIDKGYNAIDIETNKLYKKDFRTLSDLQETKLREIRSDYTKANESDISYKSTVFQVYKESQSLIVSVLSAGSVPTDFYWLDKSNIKIPMTYNELQGLSLEILTRGQTNFSKYQTLKNNIQVATTQADLDLIKW